ncbi:MAG: T9SS type A sorting domain-containing protein [Bacteroidales bacterium]|jgi:hypothetical protein
MKKFTLVFLLLPCALFSYGQKVKPSTVNLPYATEQKALNPPLESTLKSEGEIFFHETFNWKDPSNPSGWTLPAGWQVKDEADLGFKWIWRAGTDSIKGRYTFLPGHIYSKTPEDGYFVLPMDEYNFIDGIYTTNGGIAWFQLPEFNCSNHPTVVLKLRQYFRCNPGPDVKVLVSNDLGVHWASYRLDYETKTNIFCKNPFPEVNITEAAGGMPNVWIKFVWNGMSRYFWCIDDITLSEAYNNELQLEQPWLFMTDLEADGDEGFTFMIPASQTSSDGFGGYTFRAGFLNAGKDDQESCLLNAQIFKNGVSVYNQNSEKVTDIWALQRDTFDITTSSVPDGYGNYQMVLTAKQNATDGVQDNNIYKDTYYITDSVYSVSDWEWETYSSTAGHGNNDGDYLGVILDIKKATEVNSISSLIMQRKDNPKASTQPGYGFQYWLFKWAAEEGVWTEVINSSFVDITQEMLNTWVTVPLEKDGESEFIEPGYYIAAIQGFHGGGAGADNNTYRFTIGSDQSHRYSDGKTVYRLITGDTWSNNEDLSMIRLNLNTSGAPQSADVVFNVDMKLPIAAGVFKPASGDFVDVAGTINGWNGSAHHLTDADGDGIYTLTVPALPTFINIEYKYRINGDWNTSEFPSGGANRVYRVSYYNMLNDVYNNGIGMGVNLNSLSSSINVFPNPSEGQFTLSVTNSQVTDLNILVTNIQGQTVYRNLVKSTLEYQETFNLTQFAKGMYFLKVNNQVIKLLVK